ncbi:MAG: hypothetical protein ACW967_01925 [Candidatus Hodarchaeales archaeon]|jgi:hypothetical protein
MKLTIDLFKKAEEAIRKNGRKLDIELFDYKFKNGSIDSVITELKKYQNEDGGFGHGIEPDFRLKSSSPMATTVGIQYCLKIGLPTDHDLYSTAIRYFLQHYIEEGSFWTNVYENVKNEPHAPWWQVDKVESPTNERWANASAEIAGFLFKFHKLVPQNLLEQLTKKIINVLEDFETIQGGLYSLMCWERGLEHFPKNIKINLKGKIKNTYKSLSPLTQEKLSEVRIFFLTKSPKDLINGELEPDVNKLFDNEIKLLKTNDGSVPTWEWGMYEEAWEKAKKEWIGKMTVDLIIALQNYSKLDF